MAEERRGTPASGRRWYLDWRVWLSMAILLLLGLVERIVGLPFRVFDWIWNLLF